MLKDRVAPASCGMQEERKTDSVDPGGRTCRG